MTLKGYNSGPSLRSVVRYVAAITIAKFFLVNFKP